MIADLEALRPEWEALWAADARATPFQHPAWAIPHAAVFAGKVKIAERRDAEGRLTALLPLTAWDEGGTRRWVPLASGHSDYTDLLAAPGWDGELALSPETVILPDVRPGSSAGRTPAAWGEREETETCPVLTRAADGAFPVPYNMRRNRTKARNRAEVAGRRHRRPRRRSGP